MQRRGAGWWPLSDLMSGCITPRDKPPDPPPPAPGLGTPGDIRSWGLEGLSSPRKAAGDLSPDSGLCESPAGLTPHGGQVQDVADGDKSCLEPWVCDWAERVCLLISQATPAPSSRPGSPPIEQMQAQSARGQRSPRISIGPIPMSARGPSLSARSKESARSQDQELSTHRGQGTETLCASLQAFIPGEKDKGQRRRPRTRQSWELQRRLPAPKDATGVVESLQRVERVLHFWLRSVDKLRHEHSERLQPPAVVSESTGSTPFDTPRGARGEKSPQSLQCAYSVQVSPEAQLGDAAVPASASTAVPVTDDAPAVSSALPAAPRGQRPSIPMLSLGGVPRVKLNKLDLNKGDDGGVASGGEPAESSDAKAPFDLAPRQLEAMPKQDLHMHADAGDGGAGPVIFSAPSGNSSGSDALWPPRHADNAALEAPPALSRRRPSLPRLQDLSGGSLPLEPGADAAASPERPSSTSSSSSFSAPELRHTAEGGESARSADGEGHSGGGDNTPNGSLSQMPPRRTATGSPTDGDCCTVAPQDLPPVGTVQWRITRCVDLLDKVQHCIEQQHLVSHAEDSPKVQDSSDSSSSSSSSSAISYVDGDIADEDSLLS